MGIADRTFLSVMAQNHNVVEPLEENVMKNSFLRSSLVFMLTLIAATVAFAA